MLHNYKWLRWSWLILTFLFLFIRFQNFQGVLTPHGVIFNDTDPYYRLHRIETMLQEQRLYPLHDQDLSYPAGVNVPWPLGLDLLIAAPLEIYQSFSRTEIASFSAIVIPFLSLPLLWAAGWIGTYLMGPLAGLLLGAVITVSSTLVYQTNIGRVDHHFLEAMLPVLLLMFILKFNERNRIYHFVWTVLVLGLAPSFAPQGWILGPFLLLGLLFERNIPRFHVYSKIFFYSFLVSLIPLSFSDRFFEGAFSWISFSWWSPWIYLSCAIILEIIRSCIPDQKRNTMYQCILGFSFILVMSFLVHKNSGSLIQNNLFRAIETVRAKHGILATTMETRSIFDLPASFWKYSDFHIIMISAICFVFFLLRRRHLFLLGYMLIPLILSFFQMRFVNFSVALLSILFFLFCTEWIGKVRIPKLHQKIALIAVTLMLMVPFRHVFGFSYITNMHSYYEPVRKFCFFLNDEFKRLERKKEDQAILAHWDYGHWLLYYTGLPVVSDPFQGPSAYEVLQLFTSDGTGELDTFTQKYPSKYLLIESGALRSFRWIETVGKDKDKYFTKKLETTGNEYFETTEDFENLMMFRFFFELGRGLDDNHPQHWRLVYISPFASPLDHDISALKAFEHVNGVTIHAHTTKKYDELWMEAKILEQKDPTYFKQKAVGNNDFEWVVPYGIYDQGDVSFDGTYVIHDSKGNELFRVKNVSEQQVLSGDRIDVRF